MTSQNIILMNYFKYYCYNLNNFNKITENKTDIKARQTFWFDIRYNTSQLVLVTCISLDASRLGKYRLPALVVMYCISYQPTGQSCYNMGVNVVTPLVTEQSRGNTRVQLELTTQ